VQAADDTPDGPHRGLPQEAYMDWVTVSKGLAVGYSAAKQGLRPSGEETEA